jgi:hypothetical protein
MRRWFTVVLFALLSAPVWADRLVTSDGRILSVKKARKLPDGSYQLTFENGEVQCPEKWIQTIEIEGDMSDYVPQSEDEQKKLEQGFVRYRGKWLSKTAYMAQLDKETAARRARIEELAAHSAFHNAYEKETKHFRIKTNASEELLDYYANLLESYYELMDNQVGIKPTPTLARTKMRVNIYKNALDFYENNESGYGGGGVVGYFDTNALNFFHEYSDPKFSELTGLHECTHLLTYLIDPQFIDLLWISEGSADYFGTCEVSVEKDRIRLEPGSLQVGAVLTVQQAIEDEEYVTLEKLLTADAFGGFEYDHAWSFIYFLNHSSAKYESGFKSFFKDYYGVAKGIEYSWEPWYGKAGTGKYIRPEEAIRVLLQKLKVKSLDELEKEWLAFVAAIEIEGPQARFERAYRAVLSGDSKRFKLAKEDLDLAITEGFDDPRAYWARGLLRGRDGSEGLRSGLDDLRKAVEVAPLQPRFRYSLGQALAGYVLFLGGFTIRVTGGEELRGTAEQIEEAKKQLGLTCELDPENDGYREAYDDFLERYERWKAEGTSQK